MIRLLYLIALGLGLACSCDGDRRSKKSAAKARIGAAVGSSPLHQAAGEALDISTLTRDRNLFSRLIYMPFQEARLRLGEALVWRGEARLSFTVAGRPSLSLSEEAEIQDDPAKDALDVLVKNDGGFSQRIIHSNGMLYRRYSQGQFIAQRDLDGERWKHADQAYGLAAMGLDLVGHLIGLGPAQPQSILGRKASCFPFVASQEELSFQGVKRPERPQGADLKAWRQGLSLESVTGTLCVEVATGTVLSSRLRFRAARKVEEGKAAFLHLEASAGYVALGDPAPVIQAPESYLESLKRARRARPATGFLDGGPIKAAASPDAG